MPLTLAEIRRAVDVLKRYLSPSRSAPNVEAIVNLVDDFRLVSEKSLLQAIKYLLLQEHVAAEPAGAATTAALLNDGNAQGTTVLILSGANISEDVLRMSICQ